jgi:hypothetical protein
MIPHWIPAMTPIQAIHPNKSFFLNKVFPALINPLVQIAHCVGTSGCGVTVDVEFTLGVVVNVVRPKVDGCCCVGKGVVTNGGGIT